MELVKDDGGLGQFFLTALMYGSHISICSFVFKNGLIQNFRAGLFPENVKYNRAVWRQFIAWLAKNYPDKFSKMFTSESRFIYNHENGSDVVPLFRRWHEEHKQKS